MKPTQDLEVAWEIRQLADKNFQLLKKNPRYPSLQFKKIDELWSVRVGLAHRALAVEDGDDFIWVWLGTHDDYEKMIKGC
ncbi:ParE family toxin-like protein [Desulforhabdus amnigena]|jgi:hypothetical protein|uniref:ParE-like toxin domain-containing protein n=1 Tax=Desulforhabdus amnigena TaxID=40218 RepID=A0A9W6FS68_9BACT|nr:hypothetical protein [Desulforhabdus amnigena]NLJ29258.1 hypothetical protein [Deltaproteobacteria bacterium]GLI34277.1 hypothetical protein DAMNIGENAA_17100 [Desulforhabdus amnigena]